MLNSLFNTVAPKRIILRASLYVGLLLGTMVLLLGTSMWLYSQQAKKAEFLHLQQIPFIKNNAQLMKSVAELENQIVTQHIYITQQEVAQPLANVKQAWLEIVDLSRNHVLMVNDNIRDNTADQIAKTAQEYAQGYKNFVVLVDDLLLTRQSRIGQYNANYATLADIISDVEKYRNQAQISLNSSSLEIMAKPTRLATSEINTVVSDINTLQLYQYIYQELLKIQKQLTALSHRTTPTQLNAISSQIASLTKNINGQLARDINNPVLADINKDILNISNQFMGSGQLFSKWNIEIETMEKVVQELKNYQLFLKRTASLIEQPNFFHLPEFQLELPLINIKVKESTMVPVGYVFIVLLMSSSLFLAWRLLVLVNASYSIGVEEIKLQHEQDQEAMALLARTRTNKEQLEDIINLEVPDVNDFNQSIDEAVAKKKQEFGTTEMTTDVGSLIDLEKFNEYHGSAEMAVFMLDDYINRNQTNHKKLKEALASKNYAKAQELNRSILKTAKILSSNKLSHCCEKLAEQLEQEHYDEVESRVGEMGSIIEQLNLFVEEI
ncbi:hypothetical protein [Thalassotalea aquiviva]|uniref:hypothetical protein n=1 Tax=Thalassotalea aquiviva TaxID=3242415 RepID=UPI00352AA981